MSGNEQGRFFAVTMGCLPLVPKKVKKKLKVAQLCLSGPMDYSPWNSSGHNTGVGSLSPSPGNLPNPGFEPRSLALQTDSLPAEPQGKSKNIGVGSLSLLQQIFPTQELNQSWTAVPYIAGGFFTN